MSTSKSGSSAQEPHDRLHQTDANLALTSTISKPNMQKLLKAISLIILDQIEEDSSVMEKSKQDEDWYVFC